MKIFHIIKTIIKLIIFFPIYCSLPHKYDGTSYEEWLKEIF